MALPPCLRVGQLRVETRYLASASGPGGDIHDVAATPFGVRLLVGDVMGTGPEAHQVGLRVLAAWRKAARSEPSLAGVAVRLHAQIAQSEHPERFVTALLVNFPGDPDVAAGAGETAAGARDDRPAEMICCGHPPPLVVRDDGRAVFASSLTFPPLGLLDLADGWCAATQIPFRDGDRLLLYTDGVSEARDARGRFFALADSAAAALRDQDAAAGDASASRRHSLDILMAGLQEHLGDGTASTDDMLIVLVQYQ